jgi:solute carrier family 27 (fatty acid transporter), member 1/4
LWLKVNITSKIGACGFMPLINKVKRVLPIYVIRIDNEMNPIRNERGHCIECEPGEKGLLIGMIGKNPTTQFSGYANSAQASSKKIIEDVFKKGQRAFNSGLSLCFFFLLLQRYNTIETWRSLEIITRDDHLSNLSFI